MPVTDPIIKNQADLVIGSRFLEDNQEYIPKYRKAGIKMITKLANTSLEETVTDSQSGFRAYSKNILSEVIPSEQGMGVSNEILMKSSKKGFKIAEVPIVVSYEGETSTQHPISHGASVTLSTLKFISIEHPLGFFDFTYLEKNAFCLLTDSGTVPEETLYFKKPCVTIRESTERPEIIEAGSNILSGLDPENILSSTESITSGKPDWQWKEALGDGKTARKVINILHGKLY